MDTEATIQKLAESFSSLLGENSAKQFETLWRSAVPSRGAGSRRCEGTVHPLLVTVPLEFPLGFFFSLFFLYLFNVHTDSMKS